MLRQNDKRGMGLIDLIIYVTVMSMLLIMSSFFVVNMIRSQRRSSEVQRALEEVRRIFTLLNYDVRSAQAINVGSSVFDVSTGVLSIRNNAGATITYRLNGGTLTRAVGAQTPESVTTSLVTLEGFTVHYAGYSPKNLEAIRANIAIKAGLDTTGYVSHMNFISTITRR